MTKEKSIKPMRGEAVDFSKLRFPCLGFPKIDGLRGMCKDGELLSKTMKLIPNKHTQELLGCIETHGFDGELTPGITAHPHLMQMSMSAFMSHDGEPDVLFSLFDLWDMPEATYRERYKEMLMRYRCLPESLKRHIKIVEPVKLNSMDELEAYEQKCLEAGYEGIMLRDPEGKYKYGKSTTREQYLLKLKRFSDAEFVVEGVELLQKNTNEAEKDEMGYTKRSTNKEGMVVQPLVGALLGTDLETGVHVRCGSGLTAEQRAMFYTQWQEGALKGQIVTYKHFGVTGVKEARRFAIFKSIRHNDDISED